MRQQMNQLISKIFLFLMLTVYPVIVRKGYADICNAKLVAFLASSILFVAGLLLFNGINLPWNKLDSFKYYPERKYENIFMGILTLSLVKNFLKGGDYKDSFFGTSEMGVGILFMLALVVTTMVMRDVVVEANDFCAYAIIGGVIVGGIAVLQFCGVDFLGMNSTLGVYDANTFLATMSNRGIAAAYFVMILPFALYTYVCTDRKIIGAVGIIVISAGVVIANSDGATLGLIVELLVIMLLLSKDKSQLNRFFDGMLLILAAWLFVFVATRFLAFREINDVARVLLNPLILMLLVLLVVIGKVLVTKLEWLRLFWIVAVVGLVLIALMPLYIVVGTILLQGKSDSTLYNTLCFDDDWGTGRGRIWKAGVDMFVKGNAFDILFGQGPGSFYKNYYNYMSEGDIPATNAHNMYLHMLVEYGIIGLVGAVGFFVVRVKYLLGGGDFAKFKAAAIIGAMVVAILLITQNISMGFIPVLI